MFQVPCQERAERPRCSTPGALGGGPARALPVTEQGQRGSRLPSWEETASAAGTRRQAAGTRNHRPREQGVEEITAFTIRHGYAILFGWILLDQLGLPVPAIPALLAAG